VNLINIVMEGKATFLTLVILFLSTASFAQQGTNQIRLQELSEKFDQGYNQHRAQALQFASTRGIPMREVLPNGKVIELQFVDNGRPVYFETHNINAAITTRTDKLWIDGGLGFNLDGSGYSQLGLWDEAGVKTSHQEFNNTGSSRVIQQDKAKSIGNHSTHVAGTLVAGGFEPAAKGMAYNGILKAWDWDRDESEMARAASKGLEISNHSYGYIHGWSGGVWYGDASVSDLEDYWFGFYTQYSQQLDQIAYNAPYYLIVKSAGNDRDDVGDGTYLPDGNGDTGYDCVGTRAISKNILTVGAVEDLTAYNNPNSVVMSSFSSWGPADDGRIKPDIVANGVDLYSPIASGDGDYDTYYGTSMSTPNAAGTLALLQKHYQNTHGGNSMRAATLKALVIHTADEAGPDPGPDYMFGWGLLNAEQAAFKISEDDDITLNVIDELVLANSEMFTREIIVDGYQPLEVTIVWTDPPGTPVDPPILDPDDPMLVNDLDLSILENSTKYYPWKLNRDNPSLAATNDSPNDVDNVETVFIPFSSAGTYTIQVGHKGSLANPQYFSMIISGIASAPAQYCTSNGNATDEWIAGVTIEGQTNPSGTSETNGYENFTDFVFQVNPGSINSISLSPDFNGRSNFEYWSVWIDFNGDKDFAQSEVVFTSGKNKSTVNGTISLPAMDPVETRMRISMSRDGTSASCGPFNYGEVEDYTIHIGGSTPPTEYCTSSGLSIDQEWIAHVSIGLDFTNDELTTDGYSYFTDPPIELNEGETYNISLSPGFFGKSQREFWRIWIDYNGDLDFSDPGEEVFAFNNARSSVTGSFTVTPEISGSTRMRISMKNASAPLACGDFVWGEVEDYLVNLIRVPAGGSGGKSGIITADTEAVSHELSIYPNPGDNWLNICYTGELNKAGMRIYNIQGAMILEQEVTSNLTSLDISNLPSGIYYLALNTGDRLIYKKIVKQ